MAQTALITGTSSGIGEESARQLSARGYELILVARRKDRLETLAENLPAKATAIERDLATEADELLARVEQRGLQVDLLVNNAGFGLRGPVLDLDPNARPRWSESTARRSSRSPTRSSRAWSSAAAAA